MACRKGSLISIVSRGNLRGSSSAGIPRAAALPASSVARIVSGAAGSKSQGRAISATRAPRSAGPNANERNVSGPAVTSARAAPVTRNATRPLPPGAM